MQCSRPWLVLAVAGVATGCPADPITADDTDASPTTGASDPTTPSTLGPTTTADPDSGSLDGPGATDDGPVATDDDGPGTSTSGDDTTGGNVGPGTCGNNVIEGGEACDLTQLGGETCESQGFEGGTLACLLDCSDFNIAGCYICGNGKVEQAEECEGAPPKGVDCEMLGFPEGGNLGCADDCTYDTSDCQVCGDDVVQGLEECDGANLDGQTCASIGFDAGALACNAASCAYDYSGCSGGQYIQDFESGMLPPEFSTSGTANWLVDGTNVIDGSFSAHSGDISDLQSSIMTLGATYAIAGTIEFTHDEDTEVGYDYLEFWMDGVMQDSWSGLNATATYTMPVPAGPHTFEWRFTKDVSLSEGLDAVFVDDIVMVGGVPT